MLKIQPPGTILDDVSNAMIDSASENWRAVLAKDESQDGVFVFGVRSTAVYCKPSCPAKRPRREQVVFFDSPIDAERSGFRACKRCQPADSRMSDADKVRRVCQYIQHNLGRKLTLVTLARQVEHSPFHFHRLFKKTLGITPRQYVEACRLEKVKQSLRRGETVTNASYAAGFTSKGRLYEKSRARLGINPGVFRRGGEGLSVNYTIIDSPIGRLLLGVTGKGICAVCIGASDEAVVSGLKEDYYAADLNRDDGPVKEWSEEFSRYFDGKGFSRDLPIDVQATAFQWSVWKQIQKIPYGQTATYSQIAERIGKPKAVRAVANACASNHVALIIPCHRVVGKRGDLRGYRWGTRRKQTLLSLESRK